MLFSSIEKYNECKNILDTNKVQYHTFKKIENREIRAIFKGVAEELDPISIANKLTGRGFNPRVVLTTRLKKSIRSVRWESDLSSKDQENESDNVTTVRNSDTMPTTVTLTLFVDIVQDHMSRDNITRKLRPPINAATAEGLMNQTIEDAPIFLLLEEENF
ncbi:hypothetical protein JTB14_017076 [Gonioctena quinquepunctata]|nr:hypothetical protein JTB14_017076 [Gonioctena quinquepunctata]